MKQKNNGTWVSWNENVTHNYKSLYKITTEEELRGSYKEFRKNTCFWIEAVVSRHCFWPGDISGYYHL